MSKGKRHHHGDLRATLILTAREHVRRNGYEALSLRELAREIGVARSAPYAHFTTREAVLREVIALSVADVTQAYRTAGSSPDTPQQRLVDACRAYLRFASEEPELFRLMFASPVEAEPGRADDAIETHHLFERLVQEAVGVRPGPDAAVATLRCWALVHGFAMLNMHGRLAIFLPPEQTEQTMIDAVMAQLRHDELRPLGVHAP